MKTIKFHALWLSFLMACLLTVSGQNQEPTAPDQLPAKADTKPTDKTEPPPATPEQAPAENKTAEAAPPPANLVTVTNGEPGLRLNFRGVPLEMVLSYLSDAAGFVIVPEVDVRGKVDIWSNQPLTKDEAVEVLNSALKKNGFAALRQGSRTLKIVTVEAAKREDIPVISGNEPESIPKSDEIVTQIIPVRSLNAVQLVRDLQPLIPEKTTITANESGNSLVITDNQTNIRRIAEIVHALDTATASISTVRVFPMKFADAKAVSTVIKEVFSSDTSSRGDLRNAFLNRFRGGGQGGFGGFGGPGGGDGDSGRSGSSGRTPVTRVVATSDERSNSLVVSAPNDLMDMIADLVQSVDVNVEDLTEVRVFKLRYSDPTEMADLLTNLFPDETRSGNNNNFGSRFGFFDGGRGGGGDNRRGSPAATESDRAKKQGRVIAVPDQRTASVVVSTSHDLMRQIEIMVAQLDADRGRNMKVQVIDPGSADPQVLQQILQDLFQNQQTSRNNRNSQNQTGALDQRSRQQQQQNSGNNQGFGGNTGVGGGNNAFGRGQ